MADKLSIPALERALKATRQKLDKLKSRRAGLEKDLAKVVAQITKLEGGGAAAAKRRPKRQPKRTRAKGGAGLERLVPVVLAESSEPLRMKEIADACKAKGFPTSSANFANVVAQYVYRDTNIIRVSRGKYSVKDKALALSGAPAAPKKPAKGKKATKKK